LASFTITPRIRLAAKRPRSYNHEVEESIMMTLSPEQRRVIGEAGDRPVPIIDPDTHQTYVIIKAEVYDRLRAPREEEEIDPSFFEIDDFEPAREDPR
jgi:hypothetical protein